MALATTSYGVAGKASLPCNAVVTEYSQLYFNKNFNKKLINKVKKFKVDKILLL